MINNECFVISIFRFFWIFVFCFFVFVVRYKESNSFKMSIREVLSFPSIVSCSIDIENFLQLTLQTKKNSWDLHFDSKNEWITKQKQRKRENVVVCCWICYLFDSRMRLFVFPHLKKLRIHQNGNISFNYFNSVWNKLKNINLKCETKREKFEKKIPILLSFLCKNELEIWLEFVSFSDRRVWHFVWSSVSLCWECVQYAVWNKSSLWICESIQGRETCIFQWDLSNNIVQRSSLGRREDQLSLRILFEKETSLWMVGIELKKTEKGVLKVVWSKFHDSFQIWDVRILFWSLHKSYFRSVPSSFSLISQNSETWLFFHLS